MNKQLFLEELNKINIKLTKKQEEQLEKYYEILVKENENINLTSITKKEEVYLKHFYDSLTLIKAINLNEMIITCLDNYETYTYQNKITNYSEIIYNNDLLIQPKKRKKQEYPEINRRK